MAFYQLEQEVSVRLRKAKLTAAEWRFWMYLTELDPWGDHYQEIDPLAVMSECEMSKPTYYRAKARFQELGLFDFQEDKTSVRNLTGVSRKRQKQSQQLNAESQEVYSLSQKFNCESQKFNSNSQKRENESLKVSPSMDSEASQTIQTITDLSDKQTAPENPEVEETNLAPEINQELVCKKDLERESISSLLEPKTEIKLSPQATPLGLDRSSEISLAGEYQNGCQKFEGQFKQRVELMPFEEWVDGRVGGRKQFKAGFVELWRQYLNTTPRYIRDLRREANIGEAKASILNTSRSPEGKEMLMARWESFEELRQQKERRESPNHQQYEIVDEVREAILKKRQALAVGTN